MGFYVVAWKRDAFIQRDEMIGFDASTLLFAFLRRMFGYFAQGIYRALLDVIQTGLSRDALRKIGKAA